MSLVSMLMKIVCTHNHHLILFLLPLSHCHAVYTSFGLIEICVRFASFVHLHCLYICRRLLCWIFYPSISLSLSFSLVSGLLTRIHSMRSVVNLSILIHSFHQLCHTVYISHRRGFLVPNLLVLFHYNEREHFFLLAPRPSSPSCRLRSFTKSKDFSEVIHFIGRRNFS